MKQFVEKILNAFHPQRQPVSTKNVIRLLIVLLVVMSLVAGYYYTQEQKLRKFILALPLEYQQTN